VEGQKTILRSDAAPGSPAYLATGRAFSRPTEWKPGEEWDMSVAVPLNPRPVTEGTARLDEVLGWLGTKGIGRADSGEAIDSDPGNFANRMKALSWFQQLPPPDVSRGGALNESQHQIQRRATHGQDLSAFFTEPCIIIVGVMTGPTPVPLEVSTGGAFRPIKSTGQTIVRWVYPLPPNPPGFATPSTSNPSEQPLPAERGGDGGNDEGGNL
jgi:hypothetical protein